MNLITTHQRGIYLEKKIKCIDCAMYQLGCRSKELFCSSCSPLYRRTPGDWKIIVDRLIIKIVKWWFKHGTKSIYQGLW